MATGGPGREQKSHPSAPGSVAQRPEDQEELCSDPASCPGETSFASLCSLLQRQKETVVTVPAAQVCSGLGMA